MHRAVIPAVVALGLAGPVLARAADPGRSYMDFDARAIAVLSDGDLVASALVDGQLGPRSPWGDRLTLIPVVDGVPRKPSGAVFVSNSVAGGPTTLAIDRAGRFAYVAETDGKPAPGVTRRDRLPPGRQVAVVDLADLAGPKVIQTLALAARVRSVTLSPDGGRLLVGLAGDGSVPVVQIAVGVDGRLGAPAALEMPGLEGTPTHVAWHPSGRWVAAPAADGAAVRLWRVVDGADAVALEAWGPPIVTDRAPGIARFTPDGRHLVVALARGRIDGADAADADVAASTLAVVRVAQAADADGAVVHTLVDTAVVGRAAPAFAISPDGRRVVAVDLRRTHRPAGDAQRDFSAALVLFDLDPATGHLTARSTTWFESVLPQAIAFDASGRFVAVASFAHADPTQPASEATVDLWRVVDAPVPRLDPTEVRIAVPRGAHALQIVR
ncbi:MAG: lactonase family protein [Burkholderiales bacterium]|nr:lactonase family protein [Burkholderiales bacterium]